MDRLTVDVHVVLTCQRCKTTYLRHKSTSRSRSMAYCSTMCELAAEGYTVEEVLSLRRPAVRLNSMAVTDVAQAVAMGDVSPQLVS